MAQGTIDYILVVIEITVQIQFFFLFLLDFYWMALNVLSCFCFLWCCFLLYILCDIKVQFKKQILEEKFSGEVENRLLNNQ